MKSIHFRSIPEYLQFQESFMLDPLKINCGVLVHTNTGTQTLEQCG